MPEGTPIDRARLLSVGVLSRGRTRDHVVEGRDQHGRRYKATTDELNNTVTQRDGARRGEEHQDVLIRAPHLHTAMTTREVRQ